MNKIPFLAALLAVAIFAFPAHAQDAEKSRRQARRQPIAGRARQPGTTSAASSSPWPKISPRTNTTSSPRPPSAPSPSNSSTPPTPIISSPIRLMGEKPPAEEDPKRDQYKTKADVVAFVKKAFADGAAAIKAKGDKGMSDLVVDPFANQQVRISDFAYGFIEHSGEHYGQLVVYYRLSGLVPPESRPKNNQSDHAVEKKRCHPEARALCGPKDPCNRRHDCGHTRNGRLRKQLLAFTIWMNQPSLASIRIPQRSAPQTPSPAAPRKQIRPRAPRTPPRPCSASARPARRRPAQKFKKNQ